MRVPRARADSVRFGAAARAWTLEGPLPDHGLQAASRFALGQLGYRPDGRPLRMAADQRELSTECRTTAGTVFYPEAALRARVQGLVIAEALMTPAGSVSTARGIRSVDPQLDLEAIAAILEWVYTPTVLDGEAVAIIMTVTVNFALRP